jgi:hypothetical protein
MQRGSIVFPRFFFCHTNLAQNFRSAAFFAAMAKKVRCRVEDQMISPVFWKFKHALKTMFALYKQKSKNIINA